ncbi:sulfotransferase family protein [Glycomyces terrestris]|uniref:Sulfotransferase n=1 Tax=Glycomyces terrestris TaxID=2493553 RepID=A0A426V471_9ACTN|nr:sulfotransferase [Glycomyces terrestris]RRS01635.1 sulfotransferase [Glycomyces terrestris]
MERVAPWLRAVNTVLTPAIAGRRKKVDRLIERAVREAEGRTASTARGDEDFVEDMRVLLRAYADVPGLTPMGWIGIFQEITDRIENHLRIRKLHALNPELADERVDRPIVVTGAPRTGTAVLQRLLAAAEGHRAPLLHQLMHPDLPSAPADDARRRAEKTVEAQRRAIPTFGGIYDMHPDRPDSCVWVLPHGIGHLVRVHPPGYVQWMLDRDYTADYRYLKQTLQVLQHGLPRRRWVLRAPAHLWNLGALMKTFPDAQVVWTHRDPATALASLCSMTETATAVSTTEHDPRDIGRLWLGLLATGVDRARAERARLPAYTVVDVPYRHLTGQTDRLPGLFERLGVQWGRTEQEALDAAVAARPFDHRYDLARYGLGPAEVDHAFADYKRIYGGFL